MPPAKDDSRDGFFGRVSHYPFFPWLIVLTLLGSITVNVFVLVVPGLSPGWVLFGLFCWGTLMLCVLTRLRRAEDRVARVVSWYYDDE